MEAITGGGTHMFQTPGECKRTGKRVVSWPDIRADGGMVAAPGTTRSGAFYEWELLHHPAEVELAEMPDWLFTIIRIIAKGILKKYPAEGEPIPLGKE